MSAQAHVDDREYARPPGDPGRCRRRCSRGVVVADSTAWRGRRGGRSDVRPPASVYRVAFPRGAGERGMRTDVAHGRFGRWMGGAAGFAAALALLAGALFARSAEYADVGYGRGPERAETAAERWGLEEVEWRRYETLMRGRRGRWSPGADPLLVLGAHARDAEERRRYAELYVRAERERVEAELAFERAVGAAWARLFGDEAMFAGTAADAAARDLGSRDPVRRFAVAVAADCVPCRDLVREFWAGSRPVDFHVLGTGGDDDALHAWVAALGVDVRRAGVTVNHGDAFEGEATPVVLGERLDGTWMRVGG